MYWFKLVTWFKRTCLTIICNMVGGGSIVGLAYVMRDNDAPCGNAATHMERGQDAPVCVANAEVASAIQAGYTHAYVHHPVAEIVATTVIGIAYATISIAITITLWFLFLHMVWQFFNAVRGKPTSWGKDT